MSSPRPVRATWCCRRCAVPLRCSSPSDAKAGEPDTGDEVLRHAIDPRTQLRPRRARRRNGRRPARPRRWTPATAAGHARAMLARYASQLPASYQAPPVGVDPQCFAPAERIDPQVDSTATRPTRPGSSATRSTSTAPLCGSVTSSPARRSATATSPSARSSTPRRRRSRPPTARATCTAASRR